MEPIRVPAPPKEAFNKHRPMSDLIKAQIRHLKHVEEKLPASVRSTLPQHRIISENDAALYITSMTRLLTGQGAATKPASIKQMPKPKTPTNGIALAAAATATKKKPAAKGSVAARKKASSPRPKKGASAAKGKK
jgi:hypothetical protein